MHNVHAGVAPLPQGARFLNTVQPDQTLLVSRVVAMNQLTLFDRARDVVLWPDTSACKRDDDGA